MSCFNYPDGERDIDISDPVPEEERGDFIGHRLKERGVIPDILLEVLHEAARYRIFSFYKYNKISYSTMNEMDINGYAKIYPNRHGEPAIHYGPHAWATYTPVGRIIHCLCRKKDGIVTEQRMDGSFRNGLSYLITD